MSYLGFLCLGLFIGSIIAVGIRNVPEWKNAPATVGAFAGVAVSGSAVAFLGFIKAAEGSGVYMYPVGLALSLCFLYADHVRVHFSDPKPLVKLVGVMQALLILLAIVLALFLLLSPDFRCRLPGEAATCLAPNRQ